LQFNPETDADGVIGESEEKTCFDVTKEDEDVETGEL
jgi:hypothetical protein